ncbi:MAG: hypothetical protein EXR99_01395 [Gemmataceae bacterium]|nr:hypothetical protein [Gemmataceae bacterium]
MARYTWMLALILCLGLVSLATGGLYFLLRYEPSFYKGSTQFHHPDQAKKSMEFTTECFEFIAAATNEKEWYGLFREEQINSFFAEELDQSGKPGRLLPDYIQAPRISMDQDRLRLGFRLGQHPWTTVISADMKLWLAKDEPNVLAIQLESLKAGVVPISLISLFDKAADLARQNGIEVTWYRFKGKPVAVLRFQADQNKPSILLQALSIEKGALTIRGKNLETNRLGFGPGRLELAQGK